MEKHILFVLSHKYACLLMRSHLGMSSSPVMARGSGEYLGVVSGAGLTDWLPLMYGLIWLS